MNICSYHISSNVELLTHSFTSIIIDEVDAWI